MALAAVVSDPPRAPIGGDYDMWIQDGPRVLGWTTIPCMHFVDADVWTLSCKVSEVEGSSMTFEKQGAA